MFGYSIVALLGTYLGITLLFFFIDFIWLGYVAKDLYREQIGSLLLDDFKIGPAAIFYLMYLVGIMIFAIIPGTDSGSFLKTMILGGLFGFFCYATYDFTNWATLKGWTPMIVAIDIAWGVFITGITATAGFYIFRALS